ncbi:ribosomal-protein-alanine N-acetyltransferase [Ammoniphilus oxalaticus]|uniref:Ribosomal-protein-alanine N-acetyltransferase n=1 Tax=Ammoniphilus oxalaticus TaxID=66863 RepID=A0A419SFN6_9BACL|nr:ribosomal protein S18-alanine N-acetyltransferase [Ammoniphilus oxalaticus]RKD22598.1 ribosomal-protein-alanine N-acetyltransferase [Ammoniphilus oxalaticus]
MDNYSIRPMRREDLEVIHDIQQEAFPDPWSIGALLHEITENDFAHYLVLESDGNVIGYGGMWIVIDEAQITNIAIAAPYRGQRWGEKLLMSMILYAVKHGASAMTLEVRVTNIVAQRLYEKFGFNKTGIRPRYYSDNGEDALIMWVNFRDEAEQQLEEENSRYV